MLNIGSFSAGSESDGKITSLHTGHNFRSRRWGGRKFFSSIWGKLFIVLAIRFISSQNNGFLLGVRPRHLWHLLRVSPAKRRQVFGKNQPAGQSKLRIYHLIERKQWNRLEEKGEIYFTTQMQTSRQLFSNN